MNKKVLTLSAALLLAGSLTAVAQTSVDGVPTYRSNITTSATLDQSLSDVTSINPNYYYQLEAKVTGDFADDGSYVLSAERNYATGKVYLTLKEANNAVLSHTLWKIKVTDTPANGRIYSYINKETGYELAYDHAKALDASKFTSEEEFQTYLGENIPAVEAATELTGCVSNWAWYTTQDDSQKLDYKAPYAYFHNEADSLMTLYAIDPISEEMYEDNVSYVVLPIKNQKKLAGTTWDEGQGAVGIRPVVAGAKVLSAAEINSMIDANGSSLAFGANYTNPTAANDGKAQFTVCKPGTNEELKFAEGANPFAGATFVAEESEKDYLKPGEASVENSKYPGYNILLGIPSASKEDATKYLYVSEFPYEKINANLTYNALQVTTAPYRDVKDLTYSEGLKKVNEYQNYEAAKANEVDALSSRYHWKVTYYPTQDSVVFEPLNASRLSSAMQQDQLPEGIPSLLAQGNGVAWLNTVNEGIDANTTGGNAGSKKAAGVPVALYALNFGPASGDLGAFLSVGYADGNSEDGAQVNPADRAYAGTEKDNHAFVTTYQAKMNMVVRFNHDYENDYELATLDPGLYFINIKDVKDNKTQTENRVEGAYLVEDMKGHLVYDTQDDAQEFLHMPATQWVVEQLNCQKGDEYNTNKTPQVAIYNREFNSNGDDLDEALFHGQLYRNKKTGHIVTLNHQFASSADVQNVNAHSQNTTLPCEDQYAFENITAKQTPYGYFNENEAVLRNSTYTFQHLQNMKADKYLGEENGTVKLSDEAVEFELYRSASWMPYYNVPTSGSEEEMYPINPIALVSEKTDGDGYDYTSPINFAYSDSVKYGYSNDLVKPLYRTMYKLKVKDENLIDNDHQFLAITNQHKYVIATEAEIADKANQLTYAVVALKENNELDGVHAYGLLNSPVQITAEEAVATAKADDLKNLQVELGQDKKSLCFYKADENGNKTYYFTMSNEYQDLGKLEIENASLYAKIADLCETTTDAFVMRQADRKLYRTIDAEYVNNDKKVLALQTVDEQGAAYLYEDSSSKLAKENNLNYLAAENKTTTTTHEGFYVDKVAKSSAVMPQYLLAVAVDSVPSYTYCTEGLHGINPKCGHIATMPGYVEGRYLVNYNDSVKKAVIDKLSSHADAFKYNNYVRLGFVEALHMGDTLYVMKDGNKLADYKVADANNTSYIVPSFYDAANEGVVYEKVALDGKHNNVAFSFRETGDEDESFLIESNDIADKAGIGTFAGAWVKLHNNVPVLTQVQNDNGNHNTGDSTDSWKQYADYTTVATFGELINQAARFNSKFETKDASATANEAISATDVTVAATTGAVVVKGAAGKSVVITNILGQTLTSTVIASDNATIAVPAGIAVVAVEGEEAVKVVVK